MWNTMLGNDISTGRKEIRYNRLKVLTRWEEETLSIKNNYALHTRRACKLRLAIIVRDDASRQRNLNINRSPASRQIGYQNVARISWSSTIYIVQRASYYYGNHSLWDRDEVSRKCSFIWITRSFYLCMVYRIIYFFLFPVCKRKRERKWEEKVLANEIDTRVWIDLKKLIVLSLFSCLTNGIIYFSILFAYGMHEKFSFAEWIKFLFSCAKSS